jgi:hypothetical protein
VTKFRRLVAPRLILLTSKLEPLSPAYQESC